MNCLQARDRLPEFALGVAAAQENEALERHLNWCAACRREASDLIRAAAVLAFAPAPVDPPGGLEDAVVTEIRAAASAPRSSGRSERRGRFAAAAVVAAMLAVSALGWGAVMAGQAARFEDQAREAERHQMAAVAQLRSVVESAEFAGPRDRTYLASLAAGPGYRGAGAAFTVVAPRAPDLLFVRVIGLTSIDKGRLPLRVFLIGEDGELKVAKIPQLDTGGSADVSREFDFDLSVFSGVAVRDAGNAVVLSGSLVTELPLASPSP